MRDSVGTRLASVTFRAGHVRMIRCAPIDENVRGGILRIDYLNNPSFAVRQSLDSFSLPCLRTRLFLRQKTMQYGRDMSEYDRKTGREHFFTRLFSFACPRSFWRIFEPNSLGMRFRGRGCQFLLHHFDLKIQTIE